MLILIFLNLFLLTSALPSPYQYIGCISTASAPPFTPSPIKAPFTAPECLKSCSYTATLIAVGSDSCLCDAGGASASFELVDEARCNAPCTDGGKCGGEGVLSLYQLSGSGCGGDCKARNGTVPPVVPTCNVCDHVKTPIPTPTQTQVVVTSVIYPPEGCRTVISTPVTTPAGNSTGKPCPSGGCNSNNGGGSQNGSSGSSSGSSGSSGEGSNAAPDLASDSPELFAPSILSVIAAIIFGICLI